MGEPTPSDQIQGALDAVRVEHLVDIPCSTAGSQAAVLARRPPVSHA